MLWRDFSVADARLGFIIAGQHNKHTQDLLRKREETTELLTAYGVNGDALEFVSSLAFRRMKWKWTNNVKRQERQLGSVRPESEAVHAGAEAIIALEEGNTDAAISICEVNAH